MEAEYEDGILKNYKQVFKGKNARNQTIWYVSNRIVENTKNRGSTTTYFYYGDYEKDFDISNITKEKIMSVDTFCSTIPSTIEGYYHGFTSNEKFNDDTGDAFIIKYFEDGTVRMLYYGNFINGYPDDKTNNAWYIVKEVDTNYMYYKGYFEKGKPMNNKDCEIGPPPLSIEEIKDILKRNNCDLNLNWYQNVSI